MKQLISFFTAIVLLITLFSVSVWGSDEVAEDRPTASTASLDIKAKSAILMEATTGKILYEQNANESFSPASVTKIMTLLMVMEALETDKIQETDIVTVSEYASSMGGSQVFLAAGEEFTVKELIKCTVIASANDAAVALAEHTFGSESAFVAAMNERAKELGMKSSHFENVTGLDDTTENHVMSALDIAIMSQKLITYPMILQYSSTWIDTIRDGAFTLTNTNRLVRYYPGATGLKTGSTAKAKFCLSATAQRNGLSLIAVVMGAETRDIRNSETMRMLDFGFSNFALYTAPEMDLESVYLTKGEKDKLELYIEPFHMVVEKGKKDKITYSISMPSTINAPVKVGDTIGSVTYILDNVEIGKTSICAEETINSISFVKLLKKMLQTFLHPN